MIGGKRTLNLRRFVWLGDSHLYGNSAPEFAPPKLLSDNYANIQPCPYTILAANAAGNSQLNAQVVSALQYAPITTGVPATAWIHFGTNPVQAGDTAANIHTVINNALLQLIAWGYFTGLTVLWGDPVWTGTAKETVWSDLCTLLLANTNISSGCRFDARTTFGTPNQPPYFIDSGNNHLNPTGQALYAQNLHSILASSGNYL